MSNVAQFGAFIDRACTRTDWCREPTGAQAVQDAREVVKTGDIVTEGHGGGRGAQAHRPVHEAGRCAARQGGDRGASQGNWFEGAGRGYQQPRAGA